MTQATDDTTTELLDSLLYEQQSLTAVDRFSQQHESSDEVQSAKYYRDLIPTSLPENGQQYAFEVDLDACSGCKSCVAACHALNGLEENEVWRAVGQIVGGDHELPVLQHVTTACHHCVEPACLDGCPVDAYEKDETTGIVRHLDDQCIGCQYCILKCPYDVPVYSKSKGIVRKCDMCYQRLAANEAPACVQSCPNEAIRIRIADQDENLAATEADVFLPGAPSPSYTVPTTTYRSERQLPRNALPADYFSVQRSHGHFPLVVMLVLTQMSVGAFLIEQATFSFLTMFRAEAAASVRMLHLAAALGLGFVGLAASVFHLGRPRYAFRAILGIRKSWLSREILAFGVFAGAASAYVASAFFANHSSALKNALGFAASLTGVFAVFCSIMIYVDTRRPCWTFPTTAARFVLTGLILGIPTTVLILIAAAWWNPDLEVHNVIQQYGQYYCWSLLLVTVAKLLVEASVLLHLRSRRHTPHKRSALLLTGELSIVVWRRCFFGLVGGIVLPFVMTQVGSSEGFDPLFIGIASLLMLVLATIGELHARYLFFAASVSDRMPGAPAP